MPKRSFFNSPYLQESKRKQREILKKRVLIGVSVILLILIGLGFLSRWKGTNIENIEVSGNNVTDSSKVEEVVRREISGNYLWFYPKANFLLYPKSSIKDTLGERFKIFKDISVNVNSSRTLVIKVSEREGKYTWCGSELPVATDTTEKCYFMDVSGYIFDEAPYFSGDVYLKFFGAAELGENFFPDLFPRLISFHQSIQDMGIKTSSFLVKEDGDVELYLSSTGSSATEPKIILESESDFEKVVENLQAALDTEPLHTDFKKKYSSLEYIDLRFGNKVYYKFR